MGITTTNDPTITGAIMRDLHKVGTLATGKGNGRLFIITRVIDVKEVRKRKTYMIKGYRVSPCDEIHRTFVVNTVDFDNRFKVLE